MSQSMETPIVIEPAGPVRASVIWLHGLGADGHDFEPIVPQLRLPEALGVRFVFPHAPHRPVTVNGGFVMRAWYDILSSDLQQQPDLDGIADSAGYLSELVTQEIAQGVPRERLVLAGFSQGGVVALQMEQKPAGVLALSTYLAQRLGAAGLAGPRYPGSGGTARCRASGPRRPAGHGGGSGVARVPHAP